MPQVKKGDLFFAFFGIIGWFTLSLFFVYILIADPVTYRVTIDANSINEFWVELIGFFSIGMLMLSYVIIRFKQVTDINDYS